MKIIIAVSGSNKGDKNLTPEVLADTETVGRLIAQRGAILLCGGMGGVMEAAAKGARSAGGTTVGILPRGKEDANPYIDVPLATHLGYFRNSLIVYAADAVIGICGRWGTINEVSLAITLDKPTVLLTSGGGFAGLAREAGFSTVLSRMPRFAATPEEAVEYVFSALRLIPS